MKTVVELDLVGYSTIGANLEESLDVQTVAQLNEQIQSFVDAGLQAAGQPREATVMQTTGDGAILVFDAADVAHRFAEAVHSATQEHNQTRERSLAMRVFRMGAATGDVAMEARAGGGFDIAGTTIARAVRLESAAHPGALQIDDVTFSALPAVLQHRYGPREIVAGKREERFGAYSCLFYPNAPVLAPARQPAPSVEPDTASPSSKRREVLGRFEVLKPSEYSKVIFLLEIPVAERPPTNVTLAQQRNGILEWVDTSNALDRLLAELRYLTEASGKESPR